MSLSEFEFKTKDLRLFSLKECLYSKNHFESALGMN